MADKARPEMRKTTLRIPDDVFRRVKIRAVEENRHMETIVAEAIADYLNRKAKASRPRG